MIQVGGIDVVGSTLNNEVRLAVLEKVVERLLQAVPPGAISPVDVEQFRKEAVNDLQRKYPQAGIELKKN